MPRDIPLDSVPVFVYGTLQTGHGNHSFITETVSVSQARTMAYCRLWHNGFFPGLELFNPQGLLVATADFKGDMEKVRSLRTLPGSWPLLETPVGDRFFPWTESIRGELVLLPPKEDYIKRLDKLEGFYPDGNVSMYRRVLIPVACLGEEEPTVAWVYIYDAPWKRGMVPYPYDHWNLDHNI